MKARSLSKQQRFTSRLFGAAFFASSLAAAQEAPADPAAEPAQPAEPLAATSAADDAAAEEPGATEQENAPAEAATRDDAADVVPAEPRTAEPAALPAAPAQRDSFIESLLPEVHGFVSQGFIKSTGNNYLANSKDGSFEFTEVGLNLTKQIGERLRIGMQLFMRDLGPIGDYKPQFDWAYLDYRFFDWLGVRAGRTKIPFGLYNEVNDIDAARVPILLPQSVYPTSNRDFLLAQTGGEVYGNISLGPVGSLEYRAYGGTIFIDETDVFKNIEVPFVVGGRVMWETPLTGLRLGGTVQAVRMEMDAEIDPLTFATLQALGVLGPDASNLVHYEFPVSMWVASIEYAAHDVLLAAEYSQWDATLTVTPSLVDPIVATNERFYVMASFRAASWFSPGIYYAYLAPDISNRSGVGAERHDVAVTARYDINAHWLLKLEGHYLHGAADLDPALNDGTPTAQMVPDWGLFLVKTTAYF